MSELVCEAHNLEWKVVPAGVSKKTGRPYGEFRVCSVEGCTQRPPSAQKPYQQANRGQGLSADEVRTIVQDELAPIREEHRRIIDGLTLIWKIVSGKSEEISDAENERISEKLK